MRKSASLKNVLSKILAIGAIGAGLYGMFKLGEHGMAYAIKHYVRHTLPNTRWNNIKQQGEMDFDLSQLDEKTASQVQKYLDLLKEVPEMQPIFENLPRHLKIVVDSNDTDSHEGAFRAYMNSIYIDNVCLASEEKTLITLAHELCHANQEMNLLLYDSNKGMSFEDTFRIAKLGELETELLEISVEKSLRSKGLLSGPESMKCIIWDKLVEVLGEKKAKDQLALLYWTNAYCPKDVTFSQEERTVFSKWYTYYNRDSLNKAISVHRKKRPAPVLFGEYSAHDVVRRYLNRMGLSLSEDTFLSEQDYVHVNAPGHFIDEFCPSGVWARVTMERKGSAVMNYYTIYDTNNVPSSCMVVYQDGICVGLEKNPERMKYDAVERDWGNLRFCMYSQEPDIPRIKSLLKAHPDFLNRRNLFDQTLVMLAISSGNDGVVQLLLKENANLLLKDDNNYTVLNYLDEYGSRLQPETQQKIRQKYVIQEKLFRNGRVLQK